VTQDRKSRPSNYEFELFQFKKVSPDAGRRRVEKLYESLRTRRSVREFSSKPVPLDLIQQCVRIADTAPSGANMQPWHFVVVSDRDIKRQICIAAEKEERENYDRRFPREWLDALAPFGTDWHKEFLEVAPHLIVVFRVDYHLDETSEEKAFKKKHYYVMESVGIATGMLLAAIHTAGLVTLTHTPSPMGFLRDIVGRPKNETPFILLPVGYPANEANVPVLRKKSFDDICSLK
jgi:iodotyrosine deiodinase